MIDLLPEQKEVDGHGRHDAAGRRTRATLAEGSRAHGAYGERVVHERHRHRYEFNNEYRDRLEAAGPGRLRHVARTASWSRSSSCPTTRGSWPSSSTPSSSRSPNRPHPLFRDFVGAAVARRLGVAPAVENVPA